MDFTWKEHSAEAIGNNTLRRSSFPWRNDILIAEHGNMIRTWHNLGSLSSRPNPVGHSDSWTRSNAIVDDNISSSLNQNLPCMLCTGSMSRIARDHGDRCDAAPQSPQSHSKNNRIEVGFKVKTEHPNLPTNFSRLRSLTVGEIAECGDWVLTKHPATVRSLAPPPEEQAAGSACGLVGLVVSLSCVWRVVSSCCSDSTRLYTALFSCSPLSSIQ